MECTENHMPSFSSFDSCMDGFEVAHFTDEDDIRIHTKGPAKSFFEATHIGADFSLAESGLIVLMEILDGIFEGDYMLIVIMIDEVEHGSKGSGFPGTSRAGNEQKPSGFDDKALDGFGHAHLFEGEETAGDTAHNHADMTTLAKNSNAEAIPIHKLDGKVAPPLFLKFLLAAIGGDAFHEGDSIFVIEDFGIEFFHAALMPDNRGLSGGKVQVISF